VLHGRVASARLTRKSAMASSSPRRTPRTATGR
jgi:hypothetical protein